MRHAFFLLKTFRAHYSDMATNAMHKLVCVFHEGVMRMLVDMDCSYHDEASYHMEVG